MKVAKSKSKRLASRNKFSFFKDDFLKFQREKKEPDDENKCSWNLLRVGEAVEIDAKALLAGDGIEVPKGYSIASFIEQELGVDVQKATKVEEKIIGIDKKKEVEEQQEEIPGPDDALNAQAPDDNNLTKGGEN